MRLFKDWRRQEARDTGEEDELGALGCPGVV